MSKFSRGDKVRSADGGPMMEIVACSEHVAICEWELDGRKREGVFPVGQLKKPVSQQQQQPQPPQAAD